MDSKADWSA